MQSIHTTLLPVQRGRVNGVLYHHTSPEPVGLVVGRRRVWLEGSPLRETAEELMGAHIRYRVDLGGVLREVVG